MTPHEQIASAEMAGDAGCFVIDLHESHLQMDPVRHVEQAMKDAKKEGRTVLKIIHGRGKGVLQELLRRWLNKQKLQQRVTYFRASDRLDEMGAVIYVVVGDEMS